MATSAAERGVEGRAANLFVKAFGRTPRWIASAPGRVNLIGEHTDYNDGFVMPMALEHRTALAADLTNDKIVTLHSATTGESATFNIEKEMSCGELSSLAPPMAGASDSMLSS